MHWSLELEPEGDLEFTEHGMQVPLTEYVFGLQSSIFSPIHPYPSGHTLHLPLTATSPGAQLVLLFPGTQTPFDEYVPMPQRSMVPLMHPKDSGQGAHTLSEVAEHSRTKTVPMGHSSCVQGKQKAEDALDHETPSMHAVFEVVLHAKPGSHGQHTADCVAVQLNRRNSPNGQVEMQRVSANNAMVAGTRTRFIYNRRTTERERFTAASLQGKTCRRGA